MVEEAVELESQRQVAPNRQLALEERLHPGAGTVGYLIERGGIGGARTSTSPLRMRRVHASPA